MAAVPKDVTIAVVEEELAAADAYARRQGWNLTWLKDDLVLLADGRHPADRSSIQWRANLVDYRALPPIWTCFQKEGENAFTSRFPKGGSLPAGGGSIFHPSSIICAPFNRLAFKEHSGPHGDWGGPANWMQVRASVTATVLGQMLALIVIHLNSSPGWQ
jgi:hypothetical protein